MKSVLSDACVLKLKKFEGPFDLLYYLIEKSEINIYDIQINVIADQYMDYLNAMQKMDLEITSEFLVMASTLLHIKSRLLLPVEKDSENEEHDTKEDLIIRLLEYSKYKSFAELLKTRQNEWENAFYKDPEPICIEIDEDLEMAPELLGLTYSELMRIYQEKQNDNSKKMHKIIQHEKVSLRAKMKDILKKIKKHGILSFGAIFNIKKNSRLEIATGFLGMLELTKMRKINIEQKEMFSNILLSTAIDDGNNQLDIYNSQITNKSTA